MRADGRATLRIESVARADSYLVLRDGGETGPPVRIEGSVKTWSDDR